MSYTYGQPSGISDTVIRHYWSESSHDRTEYLEELVCRLERHGVPHTVRLGWRDYDLDIYPHGWTRLKLCTVQEDHAGGKRLIRVRIQLYPNAQMAWALGLLIAIELTALASWPMILPALALGMLLVLAWREGLTRRGHLLTISDAAAAGVGLLSLQPEDSMEAPQETEELAPAPPTARLQPVPAERNPDVREFLAPLPSH